MTDLKAYFVEDKARDAEGQLIIWAETRGKAIVAALNTDVFDGFEYTDLRATREKQFDEYSEAKRVPLQELLENGWWIYCSNCGGPQIYEEDILNGKAFIDSETEEYHSFIKGTAICKKCYNKLNKERQ